MFFKKLDNGKYRYYEKYYDDFEGKWKQVSVTLTSKSRAMQAEARRLLAEKIERKSQTTFQVSDSLVSDIYEEWLTIRQMELKESTFRMQKNLFDGFMKCFGNKKLNQITSQEIQKYLIKGDWSSSYRNLAKTIIALFFKYCLNSGYIVENPMLRVVLPRKKQNLEDVIRKKEKYLNQTQMKAFLEFLEGENKNPVFRMLAEFMYLTGLRVGEATALQWEDIDLENQYLHVKYTLSFREGGEYYLSSPKTFNAYRKVEYNKRVVEILDHLQREGQKGFVFRYQGRPIRKISFNSYLHTNFKYSGIEKAEGFRLTSHVLRHSHISLLAELNVPIKLIMERVGHGDEKTTLEIYSHVTETMRDNLREKLDTIDSPKTNQNFEQA